MDVPEDKPRDAGGHFRCETCGYDMHDNQSGQCPECGAAGPGALRMPPQWWILLAALGVPGAMLLGWLAWSLLLRAGVA